MSQFLGMKKPLNALLGSFIIWEHQKRCTESAQKIFGTGLRIVGRNWPAKCRQFKRRPLLHSKQQEAPYAISVPKPPDIGAHDCQDEPLEAEGKTDGSVAPSEPRS